MESKFKKFFETQYRTELRKILKYGKEQPNRTNTPALVQSEPVHFVIDLTTEGVPALRGKKMFPKKALAEAFWIMQGFHTLDFLHEHDVTYWDIFAKPLKGSIGNGYGVRLRNLNGVDQLNRAVQMLIKSPESRQIVISFWDPADDSIVVPCYTTIQFLVIDGKLDMHVIQRSGDAFIGVPTDAMVFSYIAGFISTYTEIPLGLIYYTINDFHLYIDHIKPARKYLLASIKWADKHKRIYPTPNRVLLKWHRGLSDTVDTFMRMCLNMGLDRVYTTYAYDSFPFIKAEISI